MRREAEKTFPAAYGCRASILVRGECGTLFVELMMFMGKECACTRSRWEGGR